MTHPSQPAQSTDLPSPCDEEYSLPRAEALLAGTLALMTGYVQACCDSHREAMGHKIVTNLQLLGQADVFTPHFCTMLRNLRTRWVQQCGAATEAPVSAALSVAEQRRALWVAAPEVVQ
ncbi:MAG: hypothetical protein Q8N13_01345 [Acidovorax sp.]|nr:hypothetical protein [Acidovorax sp.]